MRLTSAGVVLLGLIAIGFLACSKPRAAAPEPEIETGAAPGADITVGHPSFGEVQRAYIEGSLQVIPYAGGMLASLFDVFFPAHKPNIWPEIEAKVKTMITSAIDEENLGLAIQDATGFLDGQQKPLAPTHSYLVALKDDQQNAAAAFWAVAESEFGSNTELFQRKDFMGHDYRVELLTYFAIYANMHLSILRDGVIAGPKHWGWNETYTQHWVDTLRQTIADYTAYVQEVYPIGFERTAQNPDPQWDSCNRETPWLVVNRYRREMTRDVLDFMHMWPYFDVTKYPKGTKVVLDRELYSDPIGWDAAYQTEIPLPGRSNGPVDRVLRFYENDSYLFPATKTVEVLTTPPNQMVGLQVGWGGNAANDLGPGRCRQAEPGYQNACVCDGANCFIQVGGMRLDEGGDFASAQCCGTDNLPHKAGDAACRTASSMTACESLWKETTTDTSPTGVLGRESPVTNLINFGEWGPDGNPTTIWPVDQVYYQVTYGSQYYGHLSFNYPPHSSGWHMMWSERGESGHPWCVQPTSLDGHYLSNMWFTPVTDGGLLLLGWQLAPTPPDSPQAVRTRFVTSPAAPTTSLETSEGPVGAETLAEWQAQREAFWSRFSWPSPETSERWQAWAAEREAELSR